MQIRGGIDPPNPADVGHDVVCDCRHGLLLIRSVESPPSDAGTLFSVIPSWDSGGLHAAGLVKRSRITSAASVPAR